MRRQEQFDLNDPNQRSLFEGWFTYHLGRNPLTVGGTRRGDRREAIAAKEVLLVDVLFDITPME